MPTADVDVGTWHRIISASIGAIVTSLMVTPLDVTKTRMQVQNTSISDGITCEICGVTGTKKYRECVQPSDKAHDIKLALKVNNRMSSIKLFSNGLMEHQLPTSRLLDAFFKIAKFEGVRHLYTGLGVTLWMAAPATVLYYSTYDLLRNYLLKHAAEGSLLSTCMPLISGMTGRVFTATLISPLELMRTQVMVCSRVLMFFDACANGQARTIGADVSVAQGVRMNVAAGGLGGLWKGLIPTLWRDVPFSGVYWMAYEYYKDLFIRRRMRMGIGSWNLFVSSFLSGAVSGGIATVLTQPFDVLKTRRQASILCIAMNGSCGAGAEPKTMMPLARSVLQKEGLGAFFLGLPARITMDPAYLRLSYLNIQ